ncbi:MAG: hypothetical protein Q7S25_04385 [Candidatus Limnocylindria bacterium]|nr:hypothetical protein [Candidatus Limnocylindria bacterium]
MAARRLGRPAPPPALQLLLWGALGVAVLLIASRAVGAVSAGLGAVAGDLARALPTAAPPTALVLPAVAPGAASAEPILDELPAFTAQPKLKLLGRVPTFAIEAGRSIELSLNGQSLGSFALDPAGRFGTEVTLRDGPNIIVAKLLAGKDLVAQTSATVVLDRAAPPLTITRPKGGDALDGPEVIVAGRTAPRVSVRVNGRIVVANPDGSFADVLPVQAGPLTITVVARNEAGLETTVRLPVTVKPGATAAPAAQVGVALDRARVKPGEQVTAQVIVTDGTAPRAGVTVTLSVGVVTIGTARTDASGRATISFAAPTTEGDITVVVLAAGGSGRATLVVSR